MHANFSHVIFEFGNILNCRDKIDVLTLQNNAFAIVAMVSYGRVICDAHVDQAVVGIRSSTESGTTIRGGSENNQ